MKYIKFILAIFYSITAIYLINYTLQNNFIFVFVISIPLCLWIVLTAHELSHYLFFKLCGFKVKELRIGLIKIDFVKETKKFSIVHSGLFYGVCCIDNNEDLNFKLLMSLLSGGISGLIISVLSLVIIIMNTPPTNWKAFVYSLFLVGLYSFYITLISSNSADLKEIQRIKRK